IVDSQSKATIPALYEISQLQACVYHVPFVKMAAKAHHRHFEVDAGQKIDRDSDAFGEVRNSYEKRVAPWLTLNAIVGNIYTGSMFLCLIDLLRQTSSQTLKQISLFSYGS